MEPSKKHTILTITPYHNQKRNTNIGRLLRKRTNWSRIPLKLHKPAQWLLEKKDVGNEDKLELLYGIETRFTFTGKDRMPVNDIENRFMKGKKKKNIWLPIISNLQSITTPKICAINVTQNPTDHYELPNIAERAIRNINTKPKYLISDTINLNQISLSYLADKK